MSIASEIQRIEGNIADAYTAASGMGATMPATQNSANLATTISSIPSGGGGKYQLLDRITDDSNNPVGTVVGFHTDANNNEFAVVCLDRMYRVDDYNFQVLSSDDTISTIGFYTDNLVFEEKETATHNCDETIAYAQANSLTCSAITECRRHYFTIDGTTYYGQLPTLIELIYVLSHTTEINALDPTTGGVSVMNSYGYFSSTQGRFSGNTWNINGSGNTGSINKTALNFVLPILELPNV